MNKDVRKDSERTETCPNMKGRDAKILWIGFDNPRIRVIPLWLLGTQCLCLPVVFGGT